MSNKNSNQSSHALSDEALGDLLGSTGFVEVPPLFTNKVMQEIDALPTSDLFDFTTKKGINDSVDNLLALKRFDCNDLIGGKIHES